MNVQQLINELQQFKPEAEVTICISITGEEDSSLSLTNLGDVGNNVIELWHCCNAPRAHTYEHNVGDPQPAIS